MLSTSFWVYIPSALGILVIAAIAFAGRREKVQARFANTTALIATWLITQYVAQVLPYRSEISLFFVELSSAISVWFAVTFYPFSVEYTHDKKMSKNIWLVIIFLALCFSIFNVTGLSIIKAWGEDYGIVIASSTVLYALQLLGMLALGGYALVRILIATVRLEKSLRSRNYILIIAVGQALLTGAIGTLFFAHSSGAQVVLSASLLLMSALILFGITRHKLFDVRSFVIRAAAYSLTATVVGVLYIAPVMALFILIFRITMSMHVFVISVLVASLVSANYSKLQGWFNQKTKRIFFRDAYNPTEVISALNTVLISTIDTKRMVNSTIRIIEKYLKPNYCFFIVPDPKNPEISTRIVGDTQETSANSISEIINDKQCNFSGRILVVNHLSEGSELRQKLQSFDVASIAKLSSSSEKESLGYMIVGFRKSGKAYGQADFQVIETIASTLSIAMQNALHFEEIQQFNETLQGKVEDATRKLRTSNEKLKKMDETKDEFISMASHQLRTPLTSVKGYVSMVLDGDVGPINEQQRELLSQSFSSSQRMANLISDLLNLSRINTGKFVVELLPVYLPKVIEAELHQLREMAQAKNIELKLDMPPTFPTLMLDENKMHQVVMNLIDNAIYYTPSNGEVTIQLTETPTAVEFRVIDTGIGVPKEAQHRLFTKMFRAENAQRARPDGTGLGLFLVKKVVVSQGGAIIFDSVEGKGSTFGFHFNKKDHEVDSTASVAPQDAPEMVATA